MDDDEAGIPDTTYLRQALAPQLLPRFTRILVHTREVRDWATQATALPDAERAALLEHLLALETTVQTLSTAYAALRDSAAPTSET